MQRYLIFSPHLDDAVFSCCDHIESWQKQGNKILIVSLFTDFGKTDKKFKKRLKETGFKSSLAQEKVRKEEDVKAMTKLKVSWKHLGFTDAGYRKSCTRLIYPDAESLFSGKISSLDEKLVSSILNKLKRFKKENLIVVPLALGKNVDHLIIRKAAELLFSHKQIAYFVDYPYAQKIDNWSLKNFYKVLTAKKSIILTTKNKLKLMKMYKSQYKLFFTENPRYPEIIIYPK